MVKLKDLFFLQKLQWKSIDDFIHYYEASLLGSNSQHCIDVPADSEKTECPGRVWEVSAWHEKHMLFKQSEVIKTYLAEYPTFKIPSQSSFYH